MADKIDKALTQSLRGSVELPSQEEIQETVIETQEAAAQAQGPVEDNEQEDGSDEVDCDAKAA